MKSKEIEKELNAATDRLDELNEMREGSRRKHNPVVLNWDALSLSQSLTPEEIAANQSGNQLINSMRSHEDGNWDEFIQTMPREFDRYQELLKDGGDVFKNLPAERQRLEELNNKIGELVTTIQSVITENGLKSDIGDQGLTSVTVQDGGKFSAQVTARPNSNNTRRGR